ncbi:hypothetical protein D3C75_1223280 [compost metagenome]
MLDAADQHRQFIECQIERDVRFYPVQLEELLHACGGAGFEVIAHDELQMCAEGSHLDPSHRFGRQPYAR